MDPTFYQHQQLMQKLEILSEELDMADDIIDSLLEAFEDSEVPENFEMLEEEEKKKWIQKAIKKPGALHKSLKVKEGKNIPVSKLEKAAKKGGKMGKRARLALTLRKLKKK